MEKTVVKALNLLEALSRAEQPAGVTALARELRLTKSNAHRLLDTLVRRGYVKRMDDMGRYELSLKAWQVGVAVLSRMDVKQVAEPHLRSLVEATNESANLSVFNDGEVVYLVRIECEQPIRAHFPVGASLPAYCTSTGKAILAYQSEDVVRACCGKLRRYTSRTITNERKLAEELARIRRSGYAVNLGEFRDNVYGVAAPVWNAEGGVEAAVAVSGPADRFRTGAIRKFAEVVKEHAQQISRELGYSPARKLRAWNATGAKNPRLPH